MTKAEICAVKIQNFLDRNFPSSSKRAFTSVILTAAGYGTRMGGVSKQLYPLAGKPLIAYSLETFQKMEEIDEIIISARDDEAEMMKSLCKKYRITKLSAVAPGGKTRQESVKNGFQSVNKKSDFVLIHDAARPLISEKDVRTILEKSKRFGAACASNLVTDTVKKVGKKGMISETVPREELVTVQTPQAFRTDLYRVSLALCEKDGVEVTDDCALVEHAGFSVYPCLTEKTNLKLTTLEDADLIEMLLKERING